MEQYILQSTSWYIAVAIAVFYGLTTVTLFGITRSISITYEHFENLGRYKGKLFTLALFGIGIFMAIAGSTPLTVIAAGMLCVTGAAASVKTPISGTVHYIGSYATIAFGLASVGIDFGLWYLAIGTALGVIALWYFEPKNNTFWLEWLTLVVVAGAIRYGIEML